MIINEVLEHTTFFPNIKMALQTAMALPVTTCTIERSFYTLRRVKTCFRSTASDEQLSGLCMMSVHFFKIANGNFDKDHFVGLSSTDLDLFLED